MSELPKSLVDKAGTEDCDQSVRADSVSSAGFISDTHPQRYTEGHYYTFTDDFDGQCHPREIGQGVPTFQATLTSFSGFSSLR